MDGRGWRALHCAALRCGWRAVGLAMIAGRSGWRSEQSVSQSSEPIRSDSGEWLGRDGTGRKAAASRSDGQRWADERTARGVAHERVSGQRRAVAEGEKQRLDGCCAGGRADAANEPRPTPAPVDPRRLGSPDHCEPSGPIAGGSDAHTSQHLRPPGLTPSHNHTTPLALADAVRDLHSRPFQRPGFCCYSRCRPVTK